MIRQMNSAVDFRAELDRALAAYLASPRVTARLVVLVDWQPRPIRAGGSWVLTVCLGANLLTVDLHALPGDDAAAVDEARRLLTPR